MALSFRVACTTDIPALITLEQQCFISDRLSPRSVRWMVSRAHGQLLVVACDGQLLGYALLLLRRRSTRARLYSIAIAEQARGMGLGQQLLARIEVCAMAQRCTHLRLEVRTDNPGALGLYERNGYRRFAQVDDYYADHTSALRLEKTLSEKSRQ